jgi:hypothetical protein
MRHLAVLGTLLTFAVGFSHAALVSTDSHFGAGTITRDAGTGLDWLDHAVTKGISWNAMQAELASGGRYSGWRHATQGELLTLYANAGILFPDTQTSSDVAAVRWLMTTFGGPLGHVVGLPWENDRSWALYRRTADDWAGGGDLAIYYLSPTDIQAKATSLPTFGVRLDVSSPEVAHWLVRTAVPEPAAAIPVCVALALFLHQRRRIENTEQQ